MFYPTHLMHKCIYVGICLCGIPLWETFTKINDDPPENSNWLIPCVLLCVRGKLFCSREWSAFGVWPYRRSIDRINIQKRTLSHRVSIVRAHPQPAGDQNQCLCVPILPATIKNITLCVRAVSIIYLCRYI